MSSRWFLVLEIYVRGISLEHIDQCVRYTYNNFYVISFVDGERNCNTVRYASITNWEQPYIYVPIHNVRYNCTRYGHSCSIHLTSWLTSVRCPRSKGSLLLERLSDIDSLPEVWSNNAMYLSCTVDNYALDWFHFLFDPHVSGTKHTVTWKQCTFHPL